jgi:hypothetical protein
MNKLWDHIENLAPGLLLATGAVFWIGKEVDLFALLHTLKLETVGTSAIVGVLFLSFGYTLGVANASLGRLIFTEIPLMDYFRHAYLTRVLACSPSLATVTASACGVSSIAQVLDFVANGSWPASPSHVPIKSRKWQRKRYVFHALVGRAQMADGPANAEVRQRRIESRLLRASVLPICVLTGAIVTAISAPLLEFCLWAFAFLTVISYYYSECTLVDTFEVYSEQLLIGREEEPEKTSSLLVSLHLVDDRLSNVHPPAQHADAAAPD